MIIDASPLVHKHDLAHCYNRRKKGPLAFRSRRRPLARTESEGTRVCSPTVAILVHATRHMYFFALGYLDITCWTSPQTSPASIVGPPLKTCPRKTWAAKRQKRERRFVTVVLKTQEYDTPPQHVPERAHSTGPMFHPGDVPCATGATPHGTTRTLLPAPVLPSCRLRQASRRFCAGVDAGATGDGVPLRPEISCVEIQSWWRLHLESMCVGFRRGCPCTSPGAR